MDGLLLARDDSENHKKYAEKFLRNGIPVYIDKPIATTKAEAEKIYNLEIYPDKYILAVHYDMQKNSI